MSKNPSHVHLQILTNLQTQPVFKITVHHIGFQLVFTPTYRCSPFTCRIILFPYYSSQVFPAFMNFWTTF